MLFITLKNSINLQETRTMKPADKRLNQKGDSNPMFILVGIALTIAVIYAFNHYRGMNNDITIHVPRVEVH